MINIPQSCGWTVIPETVSNNSVTLPRPQAAASQPHSASALWCSAGLWTPCTENWGTPGVRQSAVCSLSLSLSQTLPQYLPTWSSSRVTYNNPRTWFKEDGLWQLHTQRRAKGTDEDGVPTWADGYGTHADLTVAPRGFSAPRPTGKLNRAAVQRPELVCYVSARWRD